MSDTERMAEVCGACKHWYVDIEEGWWRWGSNGQWRRGVVIGHCGVFGRDGIYNEKLADQECNVYDGVADRLFELAPEDE